MSDTSNLTKLGSNTIYQYSGPDKNILESFQNQHPDSDYVVNVIMKDVEFTSLCPKTSQPDWAKIHVSYIPNNLLVESKSLKLYFTSFRNHGEFHEDCINRIMKDLYTILEPKYIRVTGDFNDRGGLAIKPISFKVNSNFIENEDFYHQLLTQTDNVIWRM